MVTIAQPTYSLPTNPSVKWLATQERNLNRELPYPDTAAETTEEYVFRTYLQFLWLPQSIMPLQFLVPALLRVTASSSSPSTSQSPAAHPLHSLLKPILLTSRGSAQKHHERIPRILLEENEPTDSEEEYLWYAYHKDKIGEDDQPQDGQDEYEAQERLKAAWLERFERREVQIQIILHFLLVSLPGHRVAPTSEDARPAIAESLPLPLPLSPSKSKKRKRKQKVAEPPPQPLEERLESYMDKLAMWQLMHSVDSTLSRGNAPKTAGAQGKEKDRKQKDDRDWMQAFCEDVVEPLFKEKSPELCALFRSKLFPDAGNSDSDSLRLSPPPLSPKAAAKRLKSSASSKGKTAASTAKSKDADLRARSRSLSMSLEQEKRERSRSLSVGPNGLRKRGTMFEVTMTTKFSKKKGELERTASIPALPPGPSLSRTQSQTLSADHQGSKAAQRGEKSSMGSVLVAATPVKPRTESSRAQAQSQRTQSASRSQTQTQTRLPALFAGSSSLSSSSAGVRTKVQVQPSRLSRVDSLNIDTDDDDDDDDDEDEDLNAVATPTRTKRQRTISCSSEDPYDNEWKLASSPDVLFLGASGSQEWHSSGDEGPPVSSSPPGDLGGFGGVERTPVRAGNGRGRVLVGDTPTKAR